MHLAQRHIPHAPAQPTPRASRPGRAYDPVFIFMVAAMVLAVISSIALRTVVSGMGPNSVRAVDTPSELDLMPSPGPTNAHNQHPLAK